MSWSFRSLLEHLESSVKYIIHFSPAAWFVKLQLCCSCYCGVCICCCFCSHAVVIVVAEPLQWASLPSHPNCTIILEYKFYHWHCMVLANVHNRGSQVKAHYCTRWWKIWCVHVHPTFPSCWSSVVGNRKAQKRVLLTVKQTCVQKIYRLIIKTIKHFNHR